MGRIVKITRKGPTTNANFTGLSEPIPIKSAETVTEAPAETPSIVEDLANGASDYLSDIVSTLPAEQRENPAPASSYEYLMGQPKLTPEQVEEANKPVERSDEFKFSIRLLREYRNEFPKLKIPREEELLLKSDEEVENEVQRAQAGSSRVIAYETIREGYLQLAYLAEVTSPAYGMDLVGFKESLSKHEGINDALRGLTCEIRARITGGLPWWTTLPLLTVSAAFQVDAANRMERKAQASLSRPAKKIDFDAARKHVSGLQAGLAGVGWPNGAGENPAANLQHIA